MKFKSGLFSAVLLFCGSLLVAQDKLPVKFGKVSTEDFVLPSSAVVDSSTGAVIVADLGVTTFKGNNSGWVAYVFKRKIRIKIIRKNAFELATVKIPLYTDGESKESLEDFAGATYNLENGQISAVKLERRDVFSTRIDKNHFEQKFTLPGVKENSIIEYSYTIVSDFCASIPSWQFQDFSYPCLWSEYQVTIPSLLSYVFNKRGVHQFQVDQADDGHDTYIIKRVQDDFKSSMIDDKLMSITANTVKHRWVMKEVPAFYVENFLTTPGNYIDQIDFQLASTYNGETSRPYKNTWTKVTEDLLKDKDFGEFISNSAGNDWLDKYLPTVTSNNTDALKAAKDIFYYLSNNFSCTDHQGRYIRTSLQDVFKARKGNVAEINLLLTNMLLRKQITAAPVLLSTRQSGYNYASYPMLGRLDYVVCKATIDGREYYLDASQPLLGFGHLPERCYNGHARVISMEDSASVYFLADSIRERRMVSVIIVNSEKEKDVLEGSYVNSPGYIESYNIRTAIAASGEKEYFAGVRSAAFDEMTIRESWIDSLKQPELPVQTHVGFTIKGLTSNDIIYFNPILWGNYRANPFKAAIRKYPVEMPYPVNETYFFSMQVPEGFVIDEIPKSTRVSYNGNEGFFEYLVQKTENGIQLKTTINLRKANFDPEDYNSLRDFFGFIVKKESEQIVFKRKK